MGLLEDIQEQEARILRKFANNEGGLWPGIEEPEEPTLGEILEEEESEEAIA